MLRGRKISHKKVKRAANGEGKTRKGLSDRKHHRQVKRGTGYKKVFGDGNLEKLRMGEGRVSEAIYELLCRYRGKKNQTKLSRNTTLGGTSGEGGKKAFMLHQGNQWMALKGCLPMKRR